MNPNKNTSDLNPPAEANTAKNSILEKANKKDLIGAFLVIFLFYWVAYLVINWSFRASDGAGISVAPDPQNPSQFLLLAFGFIATIFIYLGNDWFTRSNRRKSAKVLLTIPLVLLVVSFALLSAITPSEDALGPAILLSLLFLLVLATYASFFLAKLTNRLLKKYSFIFPALVFLSVLSLVVPFVLSASVQNDYKSRIIENNNIKITDVTLTKTKITKEDYDRTDKSGRCCTILGKRSSGEIILSDLSDNRQLIQGQITRPPSDPGSTELWRADLFVEKDSKLTNVTKGLDFQVIAQSSDVGSGTRPVIVSTSSNKLAFFERFLDNGSFFIVNFDGSGAYIDKRFCPSHCEVLWSKDNYIYLHVEAFGTITPEESFWRVTPP